MHYSPQGFSTHEILQAELLEWVAIPISRGDFPTQGLNPGLLHCRQILYPLSHQGSPNKYYYYLTSEPPYLFPKLFQRPSHQTCILHLLLTPLYFSLADFEV